jgi:hypothetical protein
MNIGIGPDGVEWRIQRNLSEGLLQGKERLRGCREQLFEWFEMKRRVWIPSRCKNRDLRRNMKKVWRTVVVGRTYDFTHKKRNIHKSTKKFHFERPMRSDHREWMKSTHATSTYMKMWWSRIKKANPIESQSSFFNGVSLMKSNKAATQVATAARRQ